MGGLVARAPKIQIMGDSMVSAAIDGGEDDLHLELAPTLLLQMEGWFLEGCSICQQPLPGQCGGIRDS